MFWDLATLIYVPELEKNQRVRAQRSSTKGITCTAFSANLTRALSFLAISTIGSYTGKGSLLSFEFDSLRPGGDDPCVEYSSDTRPQLDDRYILLLSVKMVGVNEKENLEGNEIERIFFKKKKMCVLCMCAPCEREREREHRLQLLKKSGLDLGEWSVCC